MYVANNVGKPSEHFTARQTSYLTVAGSGDHAADTAGSALTQKTTTRPYFDDFDVLAPASAGAVVTKALQERSCGPYAAQSDPRPLSSSQTAMHMSASRIDGTQLKRNTSPGTTDAEQEFVDQSRAWRSIRHR